METIPVPGAVLRYAMRGSGPLLLFLPGGDGDATAGDALAEGLADRYTVVTYDRRGLSGSTIADPASIPDVTTHADDAGRLLAALTDEPAYVCGSSIGAVIGLELVARHPGQVRLLVAHEPPAVQVLPETEQADAAGFQLEVEEIHRTEGALPALRRFAGALGIDPADREDDAGLVPPGRERLDNLEFFLAHDAPAVRRHRFDLGALRAAADRIVLAGGESSSSIWPYRCARLLAETLGTPWAEFPGGHNGSVFRPRAFAVRLSEVLERTA
jgi:pimeloyl-ACP methyl ester carboxylesterase